MVKISSDKRVCARGRRGFLRGWLAFTSLALGATAAVSGCTPRLNWRVVRHPEGLWQASFPGKPVSFTRQLVLQNSPPVGGDSQPGLLQNGQTKPDGPRDTALDTLAILPRQGTDQAASLQEETALPFSLTLWAVVVDEQRYTLGLAQPIAAVDPPRLRLLARGLELAMVRNISGAQTRATIEQRTHRATSATGSIRLSAAGEPVPARLAMRTWVSPSYVVEAMVVGPESGFEPEAADQFLASVQVASTLSPLRS
ncbi:MAG: hypothetical protein ACO3WN_03800 [Burkholderiaceae bacterium]